MQDEDLIPNEKVIVSLTHSGYIKRISTDQYKIQKRGGRGLKGSDLREEDFVWKIFAVDTLSSLLIFSDRGRIYWQKVYNIPQGSRSFNGRAIANIVNVSSGEKIRAILPVKEFKEENYVVLLTERGIIKKVSLSVLSRPRPSGIFVLTIDVNDNLMEARVCSDESDILIATKQGKAIRFSGKDVRPMGRTARGVKGINLSKDDLVVGMETIPEDCEDSILIVTSGGFGKRTSISEYRPQNRGGGGLISQKTGR